EYAENNLHNRPKKLCHVFRYSARTRVIIDEKSVRIVQRLKNPAARKPAFSCELRAPSEAQNPTQNLLNHEGHEGMLECTGEREQNRPQARGNRQQKPNTKPDSRLMYADSVVKITKESAHLKNHRLSAHLLNPLKTLGNHVADECFSSAT